MVVHLFIFLSLSCFQVLILHLVGKWPHFRPVFSLLFVVVRIFFRSLLLWAAVIDLVIQFFPPTLSVSQHWNHHHSLNDAEPEKMLSESFDFLKVERPWTSLTYREILFNVHLSDMELIWISFLPLTTCTAVLRVKYVSSLSILKVRKFDLT